MLCKVAIKTKDLKPWRVSVIPEPEVELAPGATVLVPDFFSMLRTITGYVVDGEEDWPVFPTAPTVFTVG